jgi:UDP-N-acetyl-D-galactosamine dehydrogenase
MDINTYEVLEAAGTKWNFLNFSPGLVGGHCIGVDPYYLTHKAKELGYHAKIINSGREVNDSMGMYIGRTTAKRILAKGKSLLSSRVLVMGATFKEDVSDIRNSKVVDVIKEMKSYSCEVEVVDPHADSNELNEEYGFTLIEKPKGVYDAIIVAVNHKPYLAYNEDYYKSILTDQGILIDIKGMYKGKMKELDYWTL